MSSNFDWLMRGKVYCSEQKANSKDFDQHFDQIQWNEKSKLKELAHKGNHKSAKHFAFEQDAQEQG